MEGRRFAEALATRRANARHQRHARRRPARRGARLPGPGRPAKKAIDHLRIGSRVSPPARRAFHLWTLGSVLYLEGRYPDACGALSRAARWGVTTDKPLYLAGLGLAQLAAGEAVPDLAELRERLSDAPCGQGYGQFVLGELCFALQDYAGTVRYLRAFLERVTGGRVALQVSLSGEITRARRLVRRASQKLR